MHLKYLKVKSFLLTLLAGVLGVACSGAEEYGCPIADFEVKGRVVNPEGNPVEGIETRLFYKADTTDVAGEFDLKARDFPGKQIVLEVNDIDGSANGDYINMQMVIPIKDEDYHGGDGNWYRGSVVKEVEVQLTPASETIKK